jgi:hypothetical protein
MTHKIVITQGIHGYDQSAYYEAYCTRCHSSVRGRDRQGNQVWASKASAIKHANSHAEWHADLDGSDWQGFSVSKRVVGEVVL